MQTKWRLLRLDLSTLGFSPCGVHFVPVLLAVHNFVLRIFAMSGKEGYKIPKKAQASTSAPGAKGAATGAVPKTGKPAAGVSGVSSRPISHQEFRKDKRRRDGSLGRPEKKIKEEKEDSVRPRSSTFSRGFDPKQEAVPLSSVWPDLRKPRVSNPPSPATSSDTIVLSSDEGEVSAVDDVDDLSGVKAALEDLGVGSRTENFEKAMADQDPMAAVYAVTEEELKRARDMIDAQVCRESLFDSSFCFS